MTKKSYFDILDFIPEDNDEIKFCHKSLMACTKQAIKQAKTPQELKTLANTLLYLEKIGGTKTKKEYDNEFKENKEVNKNITMLNDEEEEEEIGEYDE